MELEGALFTQGWLFTGWLFYVLLLLAALRNAPWRRLFDSEQSNVYWGACVALLMLWALRTGVRSGLEFHLLGMTSMTLMFGWSLALIGGSLALVGMTVAGQADLAGLGLSGLTVVALPASLTWLSLLLVRAWVPKHFFVYVFINAFFTGGLVAYAAGFLALGLLIFGAGQSILELEQTVLPFFPLMFFPEAMLNGWIMTMMVGLRPQWVMTFRDEEYLSGK